MQNDLLLLSKIFALSVVVYQLDLWKNKNEQESLDSELHARSRYAVADKVMEELQEQS